MCVCVCVCLCVCLCARVSASANACESIGATFTRAIILYFLKRGATFNRAHIVYTHALFLCVHARVDMLSSLYSGD